MRRGFHIGNIFGIKILIDPSWLFIFLLVTWNLTMALGRLHPDWDTGMRVALAVVAALLFFASVLIHELAHSGAAIAQGIPVENITLFLFGGVANIQREPPSPRAEFLITIVGPIASFLLGILFLLLGSLLGGVTTMGDPEAIMAQLDPFSTVLLWLGSINLILAVFNLIPGFPLDGGRVLRSALWAATGNLRTATRWASWVGQMVAALFIVGGVAMVFGAQIPFFGTGVIGGIWLIFIGWFLNNAALQSYRHVVVQDLLAGVSVAQLARPDVLTIAPNTTVQSLVRERILGSDERAFPVVEADRLVGLVCLEDVRRVAGSDWNTTTVQEIMTGADQLEVARPDEEASAALDKLARRQVSQMPVMQGGRFVGMLKERDILRWLELQSQRGT
jgi:Zn-dependent protease/CBS domain-containing protein